MTKNLIVNWTKRKKNYARESTVDNKIECKIKLIIFANNIFNVNKCMFRIW